MPSTTKKIDWKGRAKLFKAQGYVNDDLYTVVEIFLGLNFTRKNRLIYAAVKRSTDVLLASVLLVLCAPLLLTVSLLVLLWGGGSPIFFRQLRLGKNLIPFRIYKFRTMYQESETDEYLSHLGPLEKDLDDPRVTALGSFLRRYRIDELPQLFNVLVGDMSLVGPRPLPLEESCTCPPEAVIRYAALPGMTGLWQATKSNLISYEEKFKLDAEYVRRSSLIFDLFLLVRTVFVVLKPEEPKPGAKYAQP